MAKRATTDQTEQGEQFVLPGAERISDRELAERRMRGALRASVAQQRPGDLFDPPLPQDQPLPLERKEGERH